MKIPKSKNKEGKHDLVVLDATIIKDAQYLIIATLNGLLGLPFDEVMKKKKAAFPKVYELLHRSIFISLK